MSGPAGHTPDLSLFLHALASEFDSQAGPAARDRLLRQVGRRMAERLVPPPCETLETLEIEINDLLGRLGWGSIRLDMQPAERALLITHVGFPRVGSLGEPAGHWVTAALEGLFESWLSRQPGAAGPYVASREQAADTDRVVLSFRADASR